MKQRGQSLVEMALTLPLFIMIAMGVIDLSFVLYAHVQVAAAAKEAARAGVLFPGDLTLQIDANDSGRASVIRDAVYNQAAGTTSMGMLSTAMPSFSVSSDVQISYPNPASDVTRNGDPILVTVSYRQPLWFNFLPGAIANALQVSTSATMRIQ